MYEWLDFGGIISNEYDIVWKSKIPYKIRIFMWLVRKKQILTKDNLVKRGWLGNTKCVFCGANETIDHLFVSCQIVYILWNWIFTYNGFIFQGTVLDDLWLIDSCIPLMDKLLIDLIRSAVIWVLWIEINEIIFKSKNLLMLDL
jgi:zinc-binding in reverse transcriptase